MGVCGFELLSGVTCFQPEILLMVFLVRQVCKQQILCLFVCFYENVFVSPSFLKENFDSIGFFDEIFFFFEHFEYVITLLLSSIVSVKKSESYWGSL